MKEKEKANELYWKFYHTTSKSEAKQCALIAVDEILKYNPIMPSPMPVENIAECFIQAKEYWVNVKKEIEKI